MSPCRQKTLIMKYIICKQSSRRGTRPWRSRRPEAIWGHMADVRSRLLFAVTAEGLSCKYVLLVLQRFSSAYADTDTRGVFGSDDKTFEGHSDHWDQTETVLSYWTAPQARDVKPSDRDRESRSHAWVSINSTCEANWFGASLRVQDRFDFTYGKQWILFCLISDLLIRPWLWHEQAWHSLRQKMGFHFISLHHER